MQSPHGLVDIPATNAAGLLQCSPGNTNPGLTKPRFGALDLHSAHPDLINYVRVSPSDDIQGPAAASFVYHASTIGIPQAGIRNVKGLGIHHVLVVDDTTPGGRATADSFNSILGALGGTTVRRAMNPGTTDFSSILGPLDHSLGGPWAVYFGGIGDGGAALKQAMVAGGHSDVPLVSWDGLFDGIRDPMQARTSTWPAATQPTHTSRRRQSLRQRPTSPKATERRSAQIRILTPRPPTRAPRSWSTLSRRPLAMVSTQPGCATPSAPMPRISTNSFDTAVGSVSFDGNGDSMSQYATLYAVDTGANGGLGDWVYLDQQDFGPPT